MLEGWHGSFSFTHAIFAIFMTHLSDDRQMNVPKLKSLQIKCLSHCIIMVFKVIVENSNVGEGIDREEKWPDKESR